MFARAVAHLWTEREPPMEQVTLYLCRDVYHCTPSMLKGENLLEMFTHITVLNAEAHVQKLRK